MADEQIEVKRSVARILRIFGVVQSKEKSNTPTKLPENNIQYGMYEVKELRHIDGLSPKETKKGSKNKPEDILGYLSSISANTKKTITDIQNLKVLAPEIKQARQIIISSIISPNDMQTDLVSISTNYPGLSDDVNGEISKILNNYFNDDYKLAPKLVEWYGCAGFEEGSKSLLILPQQEVRMLNEVADTWNPEDIETSGCESLCATSALEGLLMSSEIETATESIIDEMCLEGFESEADKARLIKSLVKNNFKLLNDNNGCITVTRDLSSFSKQRSALDKKISQYTKKAMQQIEGYVPNSKERPSFCTYTVSDTIETEKGDMPLVIEWPADSIIPVCAPRDNKNHVGYFLLVDDNGQPAQGNYAFGGGSFGASGVSKVAYNAAKAVYGNQVMQTFDMTSMSNEQTLEAETKVFSVAINKLIQSKLRTDGLTGLDISVHDAVGKSIFFNLLAKNKIKMVFVPEPMLVYYRFDHRPDGTGKSFLEDISFILALRTTLTIAKVMAGVDNATKHRTVEVNVDEESNNPLEQMELVRRELLNKYAPSFTTDPTQAAESILNQHVTIVPKSMAGTTEDLSVNVDSRYGNSQVPDTDTMDMLNNWMGIGLFLPPSAINQLAETEYSRSIVVTNLFFSNSVRSWQNTVHTHNKKFVRNYVSAHRGLLDKIRKILRAQGKGTDKSTSSNISPDIDTKEDNNIEIILNRVVASIDVTLPTPNVATSKAHHEEIQAYMDSVQGMVDKIFPDDLAGGDSDASTYLASLRAVIVGNILREFMSKIGFHELASIPTTDEAVMDQVKTTVQFLLNAKRRLENSAKLHKGEVGNGGDSEDSGF